MPDKFKNKYRIASARLKHWDYGWDAAYFVTICTANRQHFFGEVINGIVQLSEIGKRVDQYRHQIPDHFLFVRLGEFVVMPNHVHGIVVMDKWDDGYGEKQGTVVETPESGVSTTPNHGGKNENWKPGTLGVIINQYKRVCTIHARKINPGFAWQPRFYDHIIRNQKSFQNISAYIKNNPGNWPEDRFF